MGSGPRFASECHSPFLCTQALCDGFDRLAGFLFDEWPRQHFLIDGDVAAGHFLVAELRFTFDHDAADLPLPNLGRKRVKIHGSINGPAKSSRIVVIEAEAITRRLLGI